MRYFIFLGLRKHTAECFCSDTFDSTADIIQQQLTIITTSIYTRIPLLTSSVTYLETLCLLFCGPCVNHFQGHSTMQLTSRRATKKASVVRASWRKSTNTCKMHFYLLVLRLFSSPLKVELSLVTARRFVPDQERPDYSGECVCFIWINNITSHDTSLNIISNWLTFYILMNQNENVKYRLFKMARKMHSCYFLTLCRVWIKKFGDLSSCRHQYIIGDFSDH